MQSEKKIIAVHYIQNDFIQMQAKNENEINLSKSVNMSEQQFFLYARKNSYGEEFNILHCKQRIA